MNLHFNNHPFGGDMSQPEESAPPAAPTSGPQVQAAAIEELIEQSQPAQAEASSSTVAAPPAPATEAASSIHVYGPAATPADHTPNSELDEAYFEPTLNDVQSHHASVLARSKQLNEAPLLTSKFRDADRADREKRKADKWPNATIRIKFSDGTIVQNTFPSTSPIQPVYSFVRSTLDPEVTSKPFTLCTTITRDSIADEAGQPPRTQYPEHPPESAKKAKPNPHKTTIIPPASYGHVKGGQAQGLQSGTGGAETLAELGLVPQSVLLVRWEGEDAMNGSGFPAPLKEELKEKKVPLPPTAPKEGGGGGSRPPPGSGAGGTKQEKKIPKWLQKGLLKKK